MNKAVKNSLIQVGRLCFVAGYNVCYWRELNHSLVKLLNVQY